MTDRITTTHIDAKIENVNAMLTRRGSAHLIAANRAYGKTGIHKTDLDGSVRGTLLPTTSSREAAQFLDGMRQALFLLSD